MKNFLLWLLSFYDNKEKRILDHDCLDFEEEIEDNTYPTNWIGIQGDKKFKCKKCNCIRTYDVGTGEETYYWE